MDKRLKRGDHPNAEELDCLAFRCPNCPYRSSSFGRLEGHLTNMRHWGAPQPQNRVEMWLANANLNRSAVGSTQPQVHGEILPNSQLGPTNVPVGRGTFTCGNGIETGLIGKVSEKSGEKQLRREEILNSPVVMRDKFGSFHRQSAAKKSARRRLDFGSIQMEPMAQLPADSAKPQLNRCQNELEQYDTEESREEMLNCPNGIDSELIHSRTESSGEKVLKESRREEVRKTPIAVRSEIATTKIHSAKPSAKQSRTRRDFDPDFSPPSSSSSSEPEDLRGKRRRVDSTSTRSAQVAQANLISTAARKIAKRVGIAAVKKRRNPGRFECHRCGKNYSSRQNLQFHSITHEKKKAKFACDECEKVFNQLSSLKSHKSSAHKVHPTFGCAHCRKKFPYRSHLERHLIVHQGKANRQWKCSICEKKFGRKSLLDQHSQSHSKVVHTCGECGLTYKFKNGLAEHRRVKSHKAKPTPK